MEVEQLEAVEAKARQRLLEGAPGPLPIEDAGKRVAVHLAGQDEPLGEAAQLGKDHPDATLALAPPVVVRGVEEVEGPPKARLSVASARSGATSYPKFSGMLVSGPHPTQTGVTRKAVFPSRAGFIASRAPMPSHPFRAPIVRPATKCR